MARGRLAPHCSRAMGMLRRFAGSALVPTLLVLSAQSAWAADAQSDSWQWTLTPYLWLPTINSGLRFEIPPDDPGGGTSVDSEIGPSDYLTDLNGVLMLAAELRRGGG